MTPANPASNAALWRVTLASAAGTMIEYYDFLLYGSLAPIFAQLFFPTGNATVSLLVSTATFGAGFIARPLGSVVFGRIGDRYGRKRSMIFTLTLMGLCTTAIGLLPTYQQIGLLAPLLLVALRLLQGVGIGGEYGAAAVYIAEHAPANRRGLHTSILNSVPDMGFTLAMLVVLGGRLFLGAELFASWGWRAAFMISAVLVVLALFVRRRMGESPEFEALVARGAESKAPVKETFGTWSSWHAILVGVFGIVAGNTVNWFAAHIFVLYVLQGVLHVDFVTASLCVIAAMVITTPLYWAFGALSDRIGYARTVRYGMILAALGYFPLFAGVRFFVGNGQWVGVTACIAVMMGFAAMTQAPFTAFLLESFPTRIRFTGSGVAFTIGNVLFGGFMPLIGLSLVAATGSMYGGLLYPVPVLLVSALVNALFCASLRRPAPVLAAEVRR